MYLDTLLEPERHTPIEAHYDVIVCGAGPAGVAAALRAKRDGAATLLIEAQGALGGVWTNGALCLILDCNSKSGLMEEIRTRLGKSISNRNLYDVEQMKILLEQMATECNLHVLLHTRVVSAIVRNRKIQGIAVENKSGRVAFTADTFIDATGDGDLGALAKCQYAIGREPDGAMQPMTLFALAIGVPQSASSPSEKVSTYLPKEQFLSLLRSCGVEPSYSMPSLFALPGNLFCLMTNHIYEKQGIDAQQVTQATFQARRELHEIANALRRHAPGWQDFQIVATPNHIGVREGRRIKGRYTVRTEDLIAGRRFDDAICEVTFAVDVHSVKRSEGGGYENAGIRTLPYEIPMRALISYDLNNLLMAGRCISGDFYAHASYRVTGNAVATGEAAGCAAALANSKRTSVAHIDGREVQALLKNSVTATP